MPPGHLVPLGKNKAEFLANASRIFGVACTVRFPNAWRNSCGMNQRLFAPISPSSATHEETFEMHP